jgi:hypothetical protein
MLDQNTRLADTMFGHAQLGDTRLRDRLVMLAAGCFKAPAGTVTSVFSDVAEREGAYRFLENPRVAASAVMAAQAAATALVARAEPFIFVPVDGSSLTLTDRAGRREVGVVGAHKFKARGLIVVSALGVGADGTPLGLLGQSWWTRDRAKKGARRELRYSTDVVDEVLTVMSEKAPTTQVWLQLDRLYDAQLVLEHLADKDTLFTVRANHNRRLHTPGKNTRTYVANRIRRSPIIGRHTVEVPAANGLPARIAELDVRVVATVISAKRKSKTRCPIALTYVEVREPKRRKGLRWTLITNASVETLDDAIKVVDGYTTRWRIEEFHRAWKRGVCRVEETQLRGRQAIIKWATILGAVAARATRLTYLARSKPDLPARDEFSPLEMAAAVLLSKRHPDVDRFTLAEMVDLVAKLGGYTGKSSGGPPGATTLARGLRRVVDTAAALGALEKRPGFLSKIR